MRHDPEGNAAAYLGDAMTRRRRRRFEEHLIECESCWSEVELGRAGRALAESVRELAPWDVRDRVRATLAAEAPRRRSAGRAAVFALLIVVGAAVTGTTLLGGDPTSQPPSILAALADFRTARLPMETPVAGEAPDLSAIGLSLRALGAGHLDDVPVEAFLYEGDDGRRLVVYMSDRIFPVALGARRVADADGPWIASSKGVTLLCASRPHSMLAVARDEVLLRRAASAMGVEEFMSGLG